MLLYIYDFLKNRVSEKNSTTLISGVKISFLLVCLVTWVKNWIYIFLHQKLRIAFALLLLRWWTRDFGFSLLLTFSVLSRVFLCVNSAAESESFIYAWDMDCWLLSVALEAAAAAAAAAATALAWSDAPGDGVPGWWCAGFSNRKLCGNPKSWDHWIRGQ